MAAANGRDRFLRLGKPHAQTFTGDRIHIAGRVPHEKHSPYLSAAYPVVEGTGTAQARCLGGPGKTCMQLGHPGNCLFEVDALGAEYRHTHGVTAHRSDVNLGITGIVHLNHRTPWGAVKMLAQPVTPHSPRSLLRDT